LLRRYQTPGSVFRKQESYDIILPGESVKDKFLAEDKTVICLIRVRP